MRYQNFQIHSEPKPTLCLVAMFVTLFAACSPVRINWIASNHYDEFTEISVCRVQQGTEFERSFVRGVNQSYFSYYFVVENYEGNLRVGIRSEPLIPVIGEVQIKANGKLYTIGYEDTPIDSAPSVVGDLPEDIPGMTPELRSFLEKNMQIVQGIGSPYRMLEDAGAVELLRAVLASQEPVRLRIVGINAALTNTTTVSFDTSFVKALSACGITGDGMIEGQQPDNEVPVEYDKA